MPSRHHPHGAARAHGWIREIVCAVSTGLLVMSGTLVVPGLGSIPRAGGTMLTTVTDTFGFKSNAAEQHRGDRCHVADHHRRRRKGRVGVEPMRRAIHLRAATRRRCPGPSPSIRVIA
jgi:hypothetical protein